MGAGFDPLTHGEPAMDATTVSSITPLVETGGYAVILALMAWLVRRVFTHTIPRLAEDFKESLRLQQEVFSKQLEIQRADFRAALAEQRADFKDSLLVERSQLAGKLDRLSDAVGGLLVGSERLVARKTED
jgi:hypothetical protein